MMHLCKNCSELRCKNIILSIKILDTESINLIIKSIDADSVINTLIISQLYKDCG